MGLRIDTRMEFIRESNRLVEGTKVGCLTLLARVLPRTTSEARNSVYWQVKCDCGRRAEVNNKVIRENRKTCGKYCLKINRNKIASESYFE